MEDKMKKLKVEKLEKEKLMKPEKIKKAKKFKPAHKGDTFKLPE
jgi:hypothetical protein